MKTYMNWFLSGGVVVSLVVITLVFSKLAALDGRLVALEMTRSAASMTAADTLSPTSSGPSPKTGAPSEMWGDMDRNNPFKSSSKNANSPTSMEELIETMPAGFDIQDPRFQDKLADMVSQKQRQRQEERRSKARDRWQDDMRNEVGSFVSEMGLEDMEGDLIHVFENVDAQRQEVLALVEEGGVAQTDLRAEMRGIHQDMEDELQDMLGEEDYEQLIRSVPMGPRPIRR